MGSGPSWRSSSHRASIGTPGSAGIALTIGGVATVLARGPAGALVDAITWKRTLIVVSAAVVAAASIAMAVYPQFWPVAFAQGLNGIADAVFPVAVTAISLGIVGRKGFTSRVGRNEAWNHAGNLATAVIAGMAGYFIAQAAVLWIVAVLAIASVVAVYQIDPRAINHDVARGEEEGDSHTPEALKLLFSNKPLLWFTAAITLFHFANAAMLPLAGRSSAKASRMKARCSSPRAWSAAQLVMVPMAILVGRKADAWGRKPLFLAGFAVLPLRGLLFALSDNPYSVVAIQNPSTAWEPGFSARSSTLSSPILRGEAAASTSPWERLPPAGDWAPRSATASRG